MPVAEIADARDDYNLNLPRYIDSTEPEDLQDIDAHLRGGVPERDIDDPVRLKSYWSILPEVRNALFEPANRPGYCQLRVPISDIKPTIFDHSEFAAFQATANNLFDKWEATNTPRLKKFDKNGRPKHLIETISEDLLSTFKTLPLLDAYGLYQHLMSYWAEIMQDDCYLIATEGWKGAAQPREILQVKDKNNKLVWPEKHDFKRGKQRRFKADLLPANLLIDRYFASERDSIAGLETELTEIEQQLDEMREEHGGEEGLLNEVIEVEGDKQKIDPKAMKARLKEIGDDPDFSDECAVLQEYDALLGKKDKFKKRLNKAREELDAKLDAKYPKLTEDEIKTLAVDDKWLAHLAAGVQTELDRVSQNLTGRIRQLAERYQTPLPKLEDELITLSGRVEDHLREMGAVWN